MPGRPAARRRRRQDWSAHNKAVGKYEDAARSLARLVESAGSAASEWSRMVEATVDKTGREAAAKMAAGGAERSKAAEDLLRVCCLDGAGRFETVPGVWRSEIAAWAVGMASLANRAAAAWSVSSALSSMPAAHVVLAEMSASDAWLDFAARVLAAERAAAGTALETGPVEVRAAAAARHAERSVPTLPQEEREGDGGDGGAAVGAMGALGPGTSGGRGAEEGERAAEEVRRIAAGTGARMAAMRREAASVWEEASALWSRAHEAAAGRGDASAVSMAAVQANAARENAARLRA